MINSVLNSYLLNPKRDADDNRTRLFYNKSTHLAPYCSSLRFVSSALGVTRALLFFASLRVLGARGCSRLTVLRFASCPRRS